MEIRDRIKKRLGDIAMQDNVHYKRWQQNEQKKRDLDQQMKETLSKIKHVEKENNLIIKTPKSYYFRIHKLTKKILFEIRI